VNAAAATSAMSLPHVLPNGDHAGFIYFLTCGSLLQVLRGTI
jgi:hypothetical protein